MALPGARLRRCPPCETGCMNGFGASNWNLASRCWRAAVVIFSFLPDSTGQLAVLTWFISVHCALSVREALAG